MAKQRHKRKRQGECAYCGRVGRLTEEHVIPRCLFTRPLPENLPVVWACQDCNEAKAKDDDYLRDLLVLDAYGNNHPTAQTLLHGKVMRAARRNQSEVVRAAKKHARSKPQYSPGGVYLGHAMEFPLDGQRVLRIFQRIVQGLNCIIRGERIPSGYVFQFHRLHPFGVDKIFRELPIVTQNVYKTGDVFTCVYCYSEEDRFETIWWLIFYDGMCYHISTEPAERNACHEQQG